MKLYTRTGDDGTTGLFGKDRVAKFSARIEAIGTVDELNALAGLARMAPDLPDRLTGDLAALQHDLFDLGADLAAPAPDTKGAVRLDPARTVWLEAAIDGLDGQLPPLKTFILPGGSEAAARLHLARAVARRAERRVWLLAEEAPENAQLAVYLNRLSDWLFAAARLAAQGAGGDIPWMPASERG